MHVPDGFLDGRTLASAAALSAGGLGVALWHTRRLPPRRVPLMGLAAAFVFAAQMINFPVAGGTSGHLIGGVLTAVLLGPHAAVLVLAAVLIVQCFLFADGGVLALGANVLNMGVVDSVAGYYVYRGVCRLLPGPRGRLAAVAFAAWCGAVLAAVVCAGELALSRTVPASVVLPAMVNVHLLVGVGEALITTLVVFAVLQARPELLDPDAPSEPAEDPAPFPVVHSAGEAGGSNPSQAPPVPLRPVTPRPAAPRAGVPRAGRAHLAAFAGYGLLIALALAVFVSPFASSSPDGLDRVAADHGFKDKEAAPPLKSPLADYKAPGIGSAKIATAIAGGVGTVVVFGLALLLARVLVPRPGAAPAGPPPPLPSSSPPAES